MSAPTAARHADDAGARAGAVSLVQAPGRIGHAGARRPFILGIGGTMRDNSTSERALRCCLTAAARYGAQVAALTGQDLMLPIYAPEQHQRLEGAIRLVDLVRQCDGLIISTPGYHGSISGMVKNALDYIEDLRDDARPYLAGRAVGLVVCAAGAQAIGTTLTALRSITHALRGWPTPIGAGLNTIDPAFDPKTAFSETEMHWQLEEVGRQVAEFAEARLLVADSHGQTG